MPKFHKEWTVLPHGELITVDQNILTVVGRLSMPLGSFPRRMVVVRLGDGRLVIWNAIALDERRMAALEAFGRPAFMIVPNAHHRLDARAWKDRYPQLEVIAPQGARNKVEQVVAVDSVAPDFGDASVEFLPVAGTRERDSALIARGGSGTTLVANDIIGNVRDASGLGGWLFRFMGLAGERPAIPKTARMMLISDAAALRRQLLRWSELPGLVRILVSHGDTIEANPGETLRELADSL